MKGNVRRWFAIAGICCAAGIALMMAALTMVGFDVRQLQMPVPMGISIPGVPAAFRCGPACGSAHLVDDGCGICGTRVLGKRRAFGLVWFRGQTRPRAPIPLLHCGSSLVAVASKLVGAPSRRPGVRRSGSNVAA